MFNGNEDCLNAHHCLICLEENPDTLPPCNGVKIPLFHKKCLDLANYHSDINNDNSEVLDSSGTKCPHCNQQTFLSQSKLKQNDFLKSEKNKMHSDKNIITISSVLSIKIDMAQHKTQSIMDRWLQDRGYWAKGPEYIEVNNSLMHQEEATEILGGVCQMVCLQFSRHSSASSLKNYYFSHPPPPDHDAFVFRHRDSEAGIETDVVLRRTAIINNRHGSIRMDGFTISMTRSRYSKRFFRKAVFIEKKRKRSYQYTASMGQV